MSRKLACIACIFGLLLSPGVAADRDIRSSDIWIEATLVTAYSLNERLSPIAIDIAVDDGEVRLAGEVPSAVERDLAESIARDVEGVQGVDNQLEIQETAEPPAEDTAFRDRVMDATLTARVRSRLLWDQQTRSQGINVEVEDGTVRLTGEVDSEEIREEAGAIVRSTRGVSEVQNELEVRARAADERRSDTADRIRERSAQLGDAVNDAWLTSRVKTTLLFTEGVPGRRIDVSADDGVVRLTGEVETEEQSALAERTAAGISGVTDVQNELRTGGE